MTQANKKIIKILTKAKNELNELWEKLDKQRENLKDEIYEKYPKDVYGIKGDLVFDRKSEEINEDIRTARMAFIGMRNFLEEIEGKEE